MIGVRGSAGYGSGHRVTGVRHPSEADDRLRDFGSERSRLGSGPNGQSEADWVVFAERFSGGGLRRLRALAGVAENVLIRAVPPYRTKEVFSRSVFHSITK